METSEGEETGCPMEMDDYSTTVESSKGILTQINLLRNESGLEDLEFDRNLYLLAEKRVKDMVEYGYYAYKNPYTEKCVDGLKNSLSFQRNQNIRESINGLSGIDYNSPCISWKMSDNQNLLDTWMNGSSSRTNIMYAAHTKGAVACKFDKCVFLGLNSQGYETTCY